MDNQIHACSCINDRESMSCSSENCGKQKPENCGKQKPSMLFKMIMNKLQRFINAHKALRCGCSPRKKMIRYFTGDRNEYELINGSHLIDVPNGNFAVYVGSDRSRFIVPISYLKHPLFQSLLEKAREEYGFHHQKGLTIPCERVDFENLLSVLRKKN